MGTWVLADRGLDLADDLAIHGTSLVKSQFTKGNNAPERSKDSQDFIKCVNTSGTCYWKIETLQNSTLNIIIVIIAAISNLHPLPV